MTRFISIAAQHLPARGGERVFERERALVERAPGDDALDRRPGPSAASARMSSSVETPPLATTGKPAVSAMPTYAVDVDAGLHAVAA